MTDKLNVMRMANKALKKNGNLIQSRNEGTDIDASNEVNRASTSHLVLHDYSRIIDSLDDSKCMEFRSKLHERRSESKKRVRNKLYESLADLKCGELFEENKEESSDNILQILDPLSNLTNPEGTQHCYKAVEEWESSGIFKQKIEPKDIKIKKLSTETKETHKFESESNSKVVQWEIAENSPHQESHQQEEYQETKTHIAQRAITARAAHTPKPSNKENSMQLSIRSRVDSSQAYSRRSTDRQANVRCSTKSITRHNQACRQVAKTETMAKLDRFGRQIDKLKQNFENISSFIISSDLDDGIKFDRDIRNDLAALERKIKNFSHKNRQL